MRASGVDSAHGGLLGASIAGSRVCHDFHLSMAMAPAPLTAQHAEAAAASRACEIAGVCRRRGPGLAAHRLGADPSPLLTLIRASASMKVR